MQYSLCWLFVIFMTSDTFSRLPLLCLGKDSEKAIYLFKLACLRIYPVTSTYQDQEESNEKKDIHWYMTVMVAYCSSEHVLQCRKKGGRLLRAKIEMKKDVEK